MRIPAATYRVQFNQDFRFRDAAALAPHLDRLGISHLYASPIFAARSGSSHGYDVIDPNRLNPELGSAEDFELLVSALKERGMGLLLDIVPNHMAASPENAWWFDVLENGAASPYASYFGIDWGASGDSLQDKIFLPILGAPYGTVLEKGEIQLRYQTGKFYLEYYSHKLPVTPASYARILGPQSESDMPHILEHILEQWNADDSESRDRLDALIQEQPYRLAFWRVATERINYRRFFDVSDLIGMRVEDPKVFEASHKLVFDLLRTNRVDGLRIDHIDGLADPAGYQSRLPVGNVYVVVEKVLVGAEALPEEWPVQGTTGYDFLGNVSSFFVEPLGLDRLDAHYRKVTGSAAGFEDITYERRIRIISTLFSGEMQDLGAHLASLAAEDRNARDLSLRDMTQAIIQVTASMVVYRTYTGSMSVSERDQVYILEACAEARRRNPSVDPLVFDFVERVLTLRFKRWMTEANRSDWLRFVQRWQQLSGPVMAKGVEDSSLYVYNRLISMNDVGGVMHPVDAADLHAFFARRCARWPHTMNATSTHDTKRSEDVRARINVLSEIPDDWTRNTARWSRILTDRRGQVDRNEEYFLFQTLIGAWPLQESEVQDFRQRLKEYVVKASREARSYTSWLQPDQEHEQALQAFIDALFDDAAFQKSFRGICERVSFYGAINSLSQLLLKVTAPGVSDFYRGTISWDFSLVDPDNRRPVDFAPLTDFRWKPRELLETWQDGRVKVFLTEKLLGYRKGNPELFDRGDYLPLPASGKRARNLFGFARRAEGKWCISAIPRFASQLSVTTRPPIGIRGWLDSELLLPQGAPRRWKNVITGQTILSRDGKLPAHRVLEHFPVALLSSRV